MIKSVINLVACFLAVAALAATPVIQAGNVPNTVFLPLISTAPTSIGVVSGRWSGTLTQPGSSFPFEMSLTQEGSNLRGTSTIRSGNTYATMSLVGDFDGQIVRFEEVEIIDQSLPPLAGRWCIKTGTLTYSESFGTLRLQGSWNDPGCNSGDIRIYKQ